jgi:hypothetical protein
MTSTIVSISRRVSSKTGNTIYLIALSNGKTIVREEFQFAIDCSNSLMDEEDAQLDCVGGTVEGDFQFNAKGTLYALDATSSKIKNPTINPATGELYKVGDLVARDTDSIRVNGFLTFRRSEAAQQAYMIAKQMAKMQAQRLHAAPKMAAASAAIATASASITPGEDEEVFEEANTLAAPADEPVVETTAAPAEEAAATA